MASQRHQKQFGLGGEANDERVLGLVWCSSRHPRKDIDIFLEHRQWLLTERLLVPESLPSILALGAIPPPGLCLIDVPREKSFLAVLKLFPLGSSRQVLMKLGSSEHAARHSAVSNGSFLQRQDQANFPYSL